MNGNIIVTMEDTLTGKEVKRTIDALNACVAKNDGWVLGSTLEIHNSLTSWIKERANDQHNTILELIGWEIVPYEA